MLTAVRAGREILRAAGSALDAVVEAVRLMEDDPLFNAGFGSVLNSEGGVEMDASVMVREKRSRRSQSVTKSIGAGAVANVTMVRNPIVLARAVLETSSHVMLAGSGAERFARDFGIERCSAEALISDRARNRFERSFRQLSPLTSHGTVGAVALDHSGALAAATSSGGLAGKMPGRIGDSAILGAGTYAGLVGAASATGFGEAIIKLTLCRDAISALRLYHPQIAAVRAVANLGSLTGAEAGIIIVDRAGRLGFAHNASSMEIAYGSSSAAIRHRRLKPIRPAAR
jgi:beta-aspartyl-peptidase (threonine type)